jgi:hemerythrin superfamily protein
MGKKWYNYFVSVDQPEPTPTADAARTVAEIAASVAAAPTFAKPVTDPLSLAEIYEAAEIRPPAHGYTILKVAEMLKSEHIRNLPREVKRSSILVALEAAGASLDEVIQDAVRRDRALDAFETVQQRALEELEARKAQENQQIQAELDRLVAEYRARMQANNDAVAAERERFYGWRLQKQEEEQKIAEAVSYFVSENPITTRSPAPPEAARP